MTFAGLSETLLYALAGGAAGVVTLLYLLKLRRRRVLVPFSPLWARVLEQREATSLLQKLKRLFSWLVALTFAMLLVFAIADPRTGEDKDELRFTAILIDASASMQTQDEKPTRLGKAKEEAKSLVRALGAEERAMIIEVGAQATPLGTFTKNKDALLAAVESVKASDTGADLARALETVAASLGDKPKSRIVVFSDGNLPAATSLALGKATVEGVRVGKEGDNVGVTAFNVRRYLTSPGEYEAYLEVRNFSDKPVTCDVTLSVVLPNACKATAECPSGYECDKLLGLCANPQASIPPIALAPKGTWQRILPSLQSDGGRLVVTAEPREWKDPFPVDNRAYAYLAPRRPARIQLVTEQNLFLEALLLLDPQNVVAKVDPAEWKEGGDYDLVIFDGVAPDTRGRPGNYWYLRPSGKHAPVELGAEPVKAPAVETTKSQHPVLKWVALKDLNIVESDPVKVADGDQVLVFGVGKGGRDAPLILARETEKGKTLIFTFDLKKSDLPLRWSFPILVPNIIAWMKGESREESSSYTTGRRWSVPISRRVDKVEVVGPDGVRREAPVRDGYAQLFGTRAGFYALYAPRVGRTAGRDPVSNGDEPLTVVAGNLQDPSESAVRPAPKLSLLGKEVASVTKAAFVERDLWVYLLFFALGLILVEWFTYHRRMTV